MRKYLHFDINRDMRIYVVYWFLSIWRNDSIKLFLDPEFATDQLLYIIRSCIANPSLSVTEKLVNNIESCKKWITRIVKHLHKFKEFLWFHQKKVHGVVTFYAADITQTKTM